MRRLREALRARSSECQLRLIGASRDGCGAAEDHGADLVLDLGGADEDQLVAGLQRVVRASARPPACRAGWRPARSRGAAARRGPAGRRTARSRGSVISTRFACDWRNVISRTRSPTVTASSTSAAIRRGLLTETSTPHCSVKSHSFSARLTRATTRGTANSVLASSDSTRFTLSSPVAATTTSQLARSASCRLASSQAVGEDPLGGGHPLGPQRRRLALDEQHLVAVLDQLLGDRAADVAGARDGDPHGHCPSQPAAGSPPVISVTWLDHVVGDQHEDLVAVLQHGRGGGQGADAEPHDDTPPGRRSPPPAPAAACETQPGCSGTSTMDTVLVGSRHSSTVPSRHQVADHPVGGPAHRGHGRDAEPLVDLGPLLVVDAGHHPVARRTSPGPAGPR